MLLKIILVSSQELCSHHCKLSGLAEWNMIPMYCFDYWIRYFSSNYWFQNVLYVLSRSRLTSTFQLFAQVWSEFCCPQHSSTTMWDDGVKLKIPYRSDVWCWFLLFELKYFVHRILLAIKTFKWWKCHIHYSKGLSQLKKLQFGLQPINILTKKWMSVIVDLWLFTDILA